jgi:hypothetical protein
MYKYKISMETMDAGKEKENQRRKKGNGTRLEDGGLNVQSDEN